MAGGRLFQTRGPATANALSLCTKSLMSVPYGREQLTTPSCCSVRVLYKLLVASQACGQPHGPPSRFAACHRVRRHPKKYRMDMASTAPHSAPTFCPGSRTTGAGYLGRPGCLLESAGGEANRILLASALLSMHIICPNRVSWCD